MSSSEVMNCVDSIVVSVDYEGTPDSEAKHPTQTGWLVEEVIKGDYPLIDGALYQGFVKCKDLKGQTVLCSTDMDGQTLLVYERIMME